MGLYTYDSTPIPKSDRIPKLVENLYAKMPEIESARAVLITESYKQTENEPMIIRRAKAFQHILENIPITIRDLELVVGSSTLAPRGCQTFPEFSYEWLEAEFDTVETRSADPFYISEQTKKELKEANAYWKGRTTSDLATAYMEPETLLDIEHNIFTPGNYFYNGVGHVTVKYGEVLEIGFSGIRKKAEDEVPCDLRSVGGGVHPYLVCCDCRFGACPVIFAAQSCEGLFDLHRKAQLQGTGRGDARPALPRQPSGRHIRLCPRRRHRRAPRHCHGLV